jgi:diguanylate cyclase (GGDEF)-like protein
LIEIFLMQRLITAFAIILGWVSTAGAVEPGPLTNVRAVQALTNAEASQGLPVAIEATVNYFRGRELSLFVEDGDAAIFVRDDANVNLVPGDRVLVKGKTHESFRPVIFSSDITVLGHGALPTAVPATFEQMIRAALDCRLVTVQGTVLSADLARNAVSETRFVRLEVLMEGGPIQVEVDTDDPSWPKNMLDSQVEIRGVAAGLFDGKMQQTGIRIYAGSPDGVKILTRAASNPWAIPPTPMNEVLAGYRSHEDTRRVRIEGTITYYQPATVLVLQDGPRSIRVTTRADLPLHIGDRADVIGFPAVDDGFMILVEGEVQSTGLAAPIVPFSTTWNELATGKHAFDLVAIEGTVVTQVRELSQDIYVISSADHLLSAIQRHPYRSKTSDLAPMTLISPGSKVRVTGVCLQEVADPFSGAISFGILMRAPSDITLVARPPWLSVENLVRVVSILLLVILAVSAWGWTLRRKVRLQTAALTTRIEAESALERRLAQLEKRRGHILEEINGSAPLACILEDIAGWASLQLKGARCWCEVTDGACLGDYPQDYERLRVIHEVIHARSGPALGRLFAGFALGIPPDDGETESLILGARLATLAIETRKLYADLRHRSEFDLLTDINNRFSLDKELDAHIESARLNAGIFGLIYIDLDEFKKVNDNYGHHIGDLYLQEVTMRMKRQLRTADMLARQGGDEFAVLVPIVRNRAEVEEIAQRLERSFDEPYAVDGFELRGSASVGVALYPEDGDTKDSLLSTADAAMYVAKQIKREIV